MYVKDETVGYQIAKEYRRASFVKRSLFLVSTTIAPCPSLLTGTLMSPAMLNKPVIVPEAGISFILIADCQTCYDSAYTCTAMLRYRTKSPLETETPKLGGHRALP